jgi:hypothetical protein
MEKRDVFFITVGLVIIGATFFVYKNKTKSFLKMSEAEKKASVEKETEKRLAIQNDKTLTLQEKIELEEAMNKKNLETRTPEEAKAIADYNLNNIMTGATQIKDAGLPSYLTGMQV